MGESKLKPLISLDVFDTAIFRKVYSPTDIFNIVEDNVGRDFKTLRMTAQDEARSRDIYYNLIDIYKRIKFPFNPKAEIKAEYENCKANPYILDMYEKGEADFVFISDMYLPAPVIKSMLEKCGYKNAQVFVSCDYRALKGDGRLFRMVEDVLGRKIDKHIGDNYHADILGAQKAGITEVEYVGPPISDREVITPYLENVKLRRLLIDNELSKSPIEEKVGYIFSPLILSFVKNLLEEATYDQTIFFNARDGFILYVIARWILKTDKSIKYCRFSRKSCHLPNINTNYRIDSEINRRAMNFFRTLRISTIREFLEMFDFEGDFTFALRELGITKDTVLEYPLQKNKILEKFVVAIQTQLYTKARESRKYFKAYINRLNMKSGDIFVDLGHFGSMQSIIRVLTGIQLHGRYIHRFEDKDYLKGIPEDKASYLPIGYLRLYTGIAELVFSEPVGTSVAYTYNGRVILNRDTKYRKDVTKGILRGIIRGVKIPYDDIIKILDRFFTEPTVEEAAFGNSKLFENGSYDSDESVVWFDKDLIRAGKLKECYSRSYWKPAFKVLMKNDPDLKSLMRLITK